MSFHDGIWFDIDGFFVGVGLLFLNCSFVVVVVVGWKIREEVVEEVVEEEEVLPWDAQTFKNSTCRDRIETIASNV